MALVKKIELNNGVVVNYHRVVSINKITKSANIIEVASYTSEDKRKEEVEKLKEGKAMDIFIHTTYLNVPYDAEVNIDDVYNYLKTTDEFKDAVDG